MGNIVRVKKDSRYFSASNEPFNDERLSWESRGLMGYLLSKPNDWVVRLEDLEKKGPAGDYKLRRMLQELRECGYVNRIRHQVEGGTFEWETHVYESPSLNPNPSKEIITTSRLSTSGLSTRGLSTRGPATRGKPRDILSTDSPNTNELITDKEKTEEEAPPPPPNLFVIYEQNIGLITQNTSERLKHLEKEYGEAVVIDAIKEADEYNARSLKYVETVLASWKKNGRKNSKGKSKRDRVVDDSPERRHKYAEDLEKWRNA